ncbi:hypothetical protein N7493_010691 [Penicillium malachiteum]|uniref:Uncharacterized protein n=1 Tax=Penicillium malachiteum TaxID=1324776 RepID=A0AAD6MRR0_9EURO|nr:hypothetical protein N7493_010691 [Penicillium malachiteum]
MAPKPSFTECAMYWCEKDNFRSLNLDEDDWMTDIYKFVPPQNSTSLSNKSSNYHISQFLSTELLNRLANIFNNPALLTSDQDSGSAAMQDIMSTNNITDVVKSVSTALTDTIRASDVSSRIPGKAFMTETYIHVRWAWVIFPLFVVLASTILLLATTVLTKDAVLWKSSVLPLLMGYLDIAPEYNFSGLRSVSEMNRLSKKITVTMEHENDLILSER